MLEFAKNKELWDRVREDKAFEWHRKEIKELYDKHLKHSHALILPLKYLIITTADFGDCSLTTFSHQLSLP